MVQGCQVLTGCRGRVEVLETRDLRERLVRLALMDCQVSKESLVLMEFLESSESQVSREYKAYLVITALFYHH